MEYKGLKYSIYPDYNALQCEQTGDYDVQQILHATKFVELAGYLKPENFIVDRRNAGRPTTSFVNYLEERIFSELQGFKFKFAPRPYLGGIASLFNNGMLLEVQPSATSYLNLELEKSLVGGYFEFIVEGIVEVKGRQKVICSNLFQLHVPEKDVDMVRLCTIGMYYDSPVSGILCLENHNWKLIRERPKNALTYLGDTDLDLVNNRALDKTWKIREICGDREKKGKGWEITISADAPSKEILDTGVPIEEYVLRRADFIGY